MGYMDDFKKVINEGIKKSEFTTHDFIKKYTSDEFFEKKYVRSLSIKAEKLDSKIFKAVHTMYGGTLKNRQDELGIEFIGKSLSTDMFGRRHLVGRYKKLTGEALEEALERGKETEALYAKKAAEKKLRRERREKIEARRAEKEALKKAQEEAEKAIAEEEVKAPVVEERVESLKPEPKPKTAPAPKPKPKAETKIKPKKEEKPKDSFEEKKSKALREAERANEELAKMLKAKGLI
jgi:hypothetical protein